MGLSTIGSGRRLPVVHSLFILSLILLSMSLKAQIPMDYKAFLGIPDSVLVRDWLVGDGVETFNITSKGHINSRGYFRGTSNLGITSGVILASGHVDNSEGPNNSPNKETQFLMPGDPILTQLAANGEPSHDASVLEFDFIPQSNSVEFKYVFGSEEYPDYANSDFNDVFGFFISGPGIEGDFPSPAGFPDGAINIALIPMLLSPTYVSINNINNGKENTGPCENCQYYVNNGEGSTPAINQYIQYDGFTTVLIARADVEPCKVYHIKLVIGDIGDGAYDSGVFLEANSFSSVGLGANLGFTHTEVDTAVEGCNSANIEFKMFDITPVPYVIDLVITGSAENGNDYDFIPAQIIIPAWDTVAVLTINPNEDFYVEDNETIKIKFNASLCPSSEIFDSVVVYIKDLQPFSSWASPGQTINCEDTITLVAAGDGGQVPYHYNWSNGEITDAIIISPPNPTTYTVQISDICGQSENQIIDINVIGPEAVACDDVSLCIGNSTTLSVLGGSSWLWTAVPPDPTLVDPTLQNPIVTPTQTTDYSVTVYDACGNEDYDAVKVSVGELTANAGADVTICDGQTTTLTASPSGNLNYVWKDENNVIFGTDQSVVVSPLTDMTYTVTINDAACTTLIDSDEVKVSVTNMAVTVSPDVTICDGDQTILSVSNMPSSGTGTYTWSDGINTYPGQSITVSPSVTTVYTVTVDDICVKNGAPVTVTVNQLPNVDASAPYSSICPDDYIILTASGALNYVWSSSDPSLVGQETLPKATVMPLETTTYTLTGTDDNQCVNSDNITITVKDRMFATFDLSSPDVCEGEEITISYTGNGSDYDSYDWDFDGGISSGTGQGPNKVQWNTTGSKTVSLIVTGNSCISEPVEQTIEVRPMPSADFTQGITEGCVPLKVDFTDASTNTIPGVTYSWDFGTGTPVTSQSPTKEFTEAGKYDVSLTVTNQGCSNTKTVPLLIDAWPVPVAGINADPTKVSMKNPVISFTSTSTGDNLSYQWNTGDGNVYDIADFTHTYADSGTYIVEILVENSFGCTDITTETITITPRYMLRIPNAFTPNGDGLNDEFTVRGNGVKKYSIVIYDKWGRLVWESKDINISWDGKLNGQPAQPGVYLYHTYFMDDNNEESKQSGSFIIIK